MYQNIIMAHSRCTSCTKKLTLAGTFTCFCQKNFCAACRYPDKHDCKNTDQIKEKDLEKLREQLVQVVANRLVDRC